MEPVNNSSFIKEQKCPNCGGTLRFVPEKGKVICEFCDAEFNVEDIKDDITDKKEASSELNSDSDSEVDFEGFDFTKFYERVTHNENESLPIYYCKSCGAEVIASYEEASITCPFCSNKIVLSDKVSGKVRPDGIIPFSIPAKDLKKHMDDFFEDKKLMPKNYFSESIMSSITGLYVPFWLFDGTVDGTFVFDASKNSHYIRGNYYVDATSFYSVGREGKIKFRDMPIDASEKMDDKFMDSVLPYDLSGIKDFDFQYLAGFAADRFDVPGKSLQEGAENRMRSTAVDVAKKSILSKYDTANITKTKLRASDIKVRYVLMPIYSFSIKYGGKEYRYAVNGQTGKVVGEVPTSKFESQKYFLIRMLVPTLIIMLILIIVYLMGY